MCAAHTPELFVDVRWEKFFQSPNLEEVPLQVFRGAATLGRAMVLIQANLPQKHGWFILREMPFVYLFMGLFNPSIISHESINRLS